MADYTAKKIDDMEAIHGGGFYKARAELGVTAFGIQVMDMPPNFDLYPEHDHSETGQEEIYMALSGSAEIEVDGKTEQLDPSVMVRVGPGARRKIRTGDGPVRIVAIGGVPGGVYESPQAMELGEPDPLAQ
jgi:mannose-6-phosphate isomerase-like protein (cupin superfamily)